MEGAGGAGAAVPLVDGLPATYNQSCTVQIAVGGMSAEAAVYQIDVQSTLSPEPWSVTATYEDVRRTQASATCLASICLHMPLDGDQFACTCHAYGSATHGHRPHRSACASRPGWAVVATMDA